MKLLPILFIISACFLLGTQLSSAQFLKPDNNIKLSGNKKAFTVSGATDSSVQQTTIAGVHAIKFTVSKTDPVYDEGYRAELGMPFWRGKMVQNVSLKTYFPSSLKFNTKRFGIWDFHDMPDLQIGETWRSPSVSAYVERDSIFVMVAWSAQRVNSYAGGGTRYDGWKTFNLGKVEKDKWASWQISVRFSYTGTGYLSISKDGKTLLKYAGANWYYDDYFPVFKCGLYWWTRDEKGNENDKIELYLADIVVK